MKPGNQYGSIWCQFLQRKLRDENKLLDFIRLSLFLGDFFILFDGGSAIGRREESEDVDSN